MSDNKTADEWDKEMFDVQNEIIATHDKINEFRLNQLLSNMAFYARMSVLSEHNIIPTTNN